MQNQLRYVIVDDEELARLDIEDMASSFSFLQKIATTSDAIEAVEIISQLKPDIIFADIEMPGINGIEMIKSLGDLVPAPVFITSHPEYALDGYELNLFDYLLKPVNTERFEKCALRLKEFFELRNNAFAFAQEEKSNFITIKQGYEKHRLEIQNIVYLEAMKDYTKIVTDSKTYLVLDTFSNMCKNMPANKFARIHRSYIINTGKIISIRNNKVYMHNCELPVSKMYKNTVNGLL